MNGTNYLLMSRDLVLLKEIAQLQVIDREQARTIGNFGSQTRLNYRLTALRSLGLLKQFFVGLGPGTKKAVFCLTRKGAQVARVPYRRTRIASGSVIGFDPFLIHRVAVADIYVSVIHEDVPTGVKASAWRFFETPLTANTQLIPDGYFELQTPEALRGMFIEMDMGTETAKIWKKKVSEYLTFAVSGEFQKNFGVPQFRVLVVATSARRLLNLSRIISSMTPKIFWLATLEDFKASPWSPIWFRPAGNEKHSIL
jgi:hypothetical protein